MWTSSFSFQICVNDDLVAKKFAVYDSQLAAGRELDEQEQEPVMLPASVLKQSASTAGNARSRKGAGLGPAWTRTVLLTGVPPQPRLQARLRVEPV